MDPHVDFVQILYQNSLRLGLCLLQPVVVSTINGGTGLFIKFMNEKLVNTL